MRFFITVFVTLLAAGLAQFLNPVVRLSPIEFYGMQQRYEAGGLMAIVLSVLIVKLLLFKVVGYERFTAIPGWVPFFVRVSVSSIAISCVAILFFLFTAIPSSPNFLMLFCLSDAVLLCVWEFLANRRKHRHSIPANGQFSRRRFLLTALLAGGIPLSLAVLAWSYKQWPEVQRRANIVQNQLGTKGDYVLADILGGLKFRQLVDFDIVPGTGEIFVLERRGRVYRIDPNRSKRTLAADFTAEIGPEPADELGAYSLKLHPDFKTGFDERLFVFHTSRTRRKSANILLEFDLLPRAQGAIQANRRIVLEIPAKGTSHNSGALDFDPEGFLFVGLGDAERKEDSQNPGNLFGGKILRIDPEKRGGEHSQPPQRDASMGVLRDYFIPHNNPIANTPEIHGEIWAIGMRNPFRIHWEPRLQALLAGDVGQLRWEEMDLVRAGDNGGWPAWEADAPHDAECPTETGRYRLRPPFFSYPHDALNRAVVGGLYYEGKRFPDLTGKIIFGDNFSGRIWAIPPDGSESPRLSARAPEFNQSGISRIVATPDGEIWIAVMGSNVRDTGSIYRLAHPDNLEKPPAASGRSAGEIFALQCSFCHGRNGTGNGPTADEFPVKPADFTSRAWQDSIDDDRLREVIRNGGLAAGKTAAMPAWKEILTEPEIAGLAEHIRSLNK